MSVDTAAILGASAVIIAAMGFLLALYSRMGRIEANVANLQQGMRDLRTELRQEMREELRNFRIEMRDEMRASTQRILDALVQHEHDAEGRALFFVPPTPAPSPTDD